MNISDLMPINCEEPKRSGFIWADGGIQFPAPCDCYDDIIVPIGSIAKLGAGVAKKIITWFPRLIRPFRVEKLTSSLDGIRRRLAEGRRKLRKLGEMPGWKSKYGLRLDDINQDYLEELKVINKVTIDNYKLCCANIVPPWDCSGQPHVVPSACQALWNSGVELYEKIKYVEGLLANPDFIEKRRQFQEKYKSYLRAIQKLEKEEEELVGLISDPGGDISWADRADALLTRLEQTYPAQLINFALNLIGLFTFVEKHKCEEEYMLNPTTCECTKCDNEQGLYLCKAPPRLLEPPNWFPQLPYERRGDERNTCVECCGGSVLVQDSIIEGGECRCECPPGMIKRPCKRKPEGMGCNPLLPFSGGLDCVDTCGSNRFDGQEAGICATADIPDGVVWSDTKCNFVNICEENTASCPEDIPCDENNPCPSGGRCECINGKCRNQCLGVCGSNTVDCRHDLWEKNGDGPWYLWVSGSYGAMCREACGFFTSEVSCSTTTDENGVEIERCSQGFTYPWPCLGEGCTYPAPT